MDVQPDKQNIDKVFSNTTYYIDFYQRHYKWNDVPVKRLLDDVFFRFNAEYEKYKDSDVDLDKLVDEFGWYYLNSYVTNKSEGHLYVVDGQQRLTTLTLTLIKLKNMAEKYDSALVGWISSKIVGLDGYKQTFWMNHEAHISTLKGLYEGKELSEIDVSSGITAINMRDNYKLISSWLDSELKDLRRFESFVFYFLRRLVLINLNVEQTDVPMVFEVINDRGVRLKPYEILKGKLLGQIDKKELEELQLNDLWERQVSNLNSFSNDEIDTFFVYFLKSKFADTTGEAKKFDSDYHRVIFQGDLKHKLDLEHNAKSVKSFLKNDFTYFTNLYKKLLSFQSEYSELFPYVYFNKLNDLNTQLLLVLSACSLNDSQEDEKIGLVSQQMDRLFCLLQLQRSYNSNDFNVKIYQISKKIRECSDLDEIKAVFDAALLDLLTDARGVSAENSFAYGLFKDAGIELGKRFKRYFFTRIELFISTHIKMEMRHSFNNLVLNTGSVNGFHIEHILSENEENHELFDNDPELFERERNRLGGLLLLKGKDNISSSNESYKNKLKSYANTLYWNESLRSDFQHKKLDFLAMVETFKLDFKAIDESFGPEELESRHHLLYQIANVIWNT